MTRASDSFLITQDAFLSVHFICRRADTAATLSPGQVEPYRPIARRGKRSFAPCGDDRAKDSSGAEALAAVLRLVVALKTRRPPVARKRDRSGANTNASSCDDDAKSATRDPGERGDKRRSRHAIRVNRRTVAKWKARDLTSDQRMGPKNPGSKLLSRRDEAIILAYRWRTRLALDDCLVRLKRQMPHLSRSALYLCLKRWGLNNIRPTAASPTLSSRALAGPFCFDITANQVAFHDDVFGWPLRSSSPSKR